jgi:hypothetical protein
MIADHFPKRGLRGDDKPGTLRLITQPSSSSVVS